MNAMAQAEEALCVRLAAARTTAPDVLRALAREGPPTVRAAVAMNPAAPDAANRLLARDEDERVRALLARKLAAQVAAFSGPEQARLNRQARETLATLAGDAAIRVRADIADVVKQMPAAPRALILQLARDRAVAVSDPVIRLSPLLTAEDLLALLAEPPSAETALSVARRADLSEAISDVLSRTADAAAIGALLSNPSAAIREATLDALIARAPAQLEWHCPLVRRPTLHPPAMRNLAAFVARPLLDMLASRADIDPALAADLRRRLADHAPPERARPAAPNADRSWDAARALHADGTLTEAAVIAAVQRGEAQLAAAMLAVSADVPLAVVDRAAALRSAKGLISLVWEAGFSMRVGTALQAMLAQLSPAAILQAGPDGAFPLATEEMRWQLDFLKRMGR